jgi:integrase
MKELIDCLKENKPNISDNTIKTYVSLLKSFYYKNHEKGDDMDCKWFENQDDIIELLKDKPASSRKTTFAALIAISKENDKYKKALLSDGKKYQEFIDTQTKTDTQADNWKTFDEVKNVYETMYDKVKPLLNAKTLDEKDFKVLQDFIILSLTSGYWVPPRRSEWIYVKLKNIDKVKDNFIEKNQFVFNKYKTAKFYEQQKVDIPKGLKTILTKWIKLNPYDYLLVDGKGQSMTNVRLTQKLNSIFDGTKISTSMLRHIYLSDKLKNVPALQELQKQAADMGHSVSEALQYVKK